MSARADALLAFMDLFEDLKAPSWGAWRAEIARLAEPVREAWWILGRGAGKSRIAGLLAAGFAVLVASRLPKVPGEQIYATVQSPSRRQSRIVFGYVRGFFRARPELEALIQEETAETITLTTGVVIEITTASIAAARGKAIALAVVEETAFLSTEESSADPDVEILRSLRPALARVPGSLLVVIGSPYARRGEAWRAHQAYAARGGSEDGTVIYRNADTAKLNPTFDAAEISRAYESDEVSAKAEYGAEFRSDVETFVPIEVVEQCTVAGRIELPPSRDLTYYAFVDPSGGSRDSFCVAIAHVEGDLRVLDLAHEYRSPLSPDWVVEQMNPTLRTYRCTQVVGDFYGGFWPRDGFAKFGIDYQRSERTKSQIYAEALPLLRSQRVQLLDDRRLARQIVGLERRVSRGGAQVIDHAPTSMDDLANAALGALVLAEARNAAGSGIRQVIGGEPWSGMFGGCVYRDGQPWEGTIQPDYDAKGRALNPPMRFKDGRPVGASPEDLAAWKAGRLERKKPGGTRIIW